MLCSSCIKKINEQDVIFRYNESELWLLKQEGNVESK